ncbi:PAS domain-containing sensor histidine kinase [Paraflavisolibacter sp. H34]|uniref:PAS domain-containing sensor histidine kinase n=1 Tax=Huijunlia imazamoxiresistens TaxID=3127457 RepID=UPI003019E48B
MGCPAHINSKSGANSTEQLEALFHNAAIGIVVTNGKGDIINFNEQAEQQFGYPKEEVLGRPVELLIPARLRSHHHAYRDNFYQDPQMRMMGSGRDLYARRKDGSEFPVEISLSPYKVEGEYFVIAFVVDIAVRKNDELTLRRQKKELEQQAAQILQMNGKLERMVEERTSMLKETLMELEDSKEELRQALEKEKELGMLKSRFVSMASHEFRTPLSTILSSVSLARKYNTPEGEEKRHKHLTRIHDAVRNLTFILEDFLSLGKLEEGQVEARPEVLSRDEFAGELENLIQEMRQIQKDNQRIEFRHQLEKDITVDRKLLHNILVNLVSNAIKYSPENALVRVDCAQEAGQLKIAVSDQGIGIPEADQKHLFERFFRARNAQNIQGTGLGLHIVGRYLQLMNGNIGITSKENEGTTFTLYIPQLQSPAASRP